MAKEATGGLKSIAEGRSDLFRIDPRKLNIKPSWNSRDFNDPANIEHVTMLANSIAEVGIKEPLTVYWEDGKAWISDGECRYRGTMQAINNGADIKTVPVKTEDRYANEADRLFAQSLRNSGKPFTALENAKLYKRLLDLGWKAQDIAKKQGITPSRVSQVLDLLTLPEDVKAMVIAGTVSATMAVQTLKNADGVGSVASATLNTALEQAKAEGSEKVKPRHVGEPKASIKTAVKDAIEYSDVDDAAEDFVIIKMPSSKWELIKNLLKL